MLLSHASHQYVNASTSASIIIQMFQAYILTHQLVGLQPPFIPHVWNSIQLYCCCMTGCYSWCCHIENYSVPPSMLKLDITQQTMHRMGLILDSARFTLWFGSSIFIHVCSGTHPRSILSCCFLPIDGQSIVWSARLCEVKLETSPQNN